MSAPTFVASASASQATAGTGPLSCNVPSGTANGDIMVAHVAVGAGAGVPSAPSGWTLVQRNTVQLGHSHVFTRLASGEPASYNWSVSVSSEYNVIIHTYRPSSGSWTSALHAISAFRWQANTSSTSQAVPTIELPAAMDMMLVSFMALGRGSTNTTQPTGYTLAENPDSGGTTTAATESGGAYLSVTSGTAPATNWSTTNSGASTTIHLALIDPATDQPHNVRAWNRNTAAASVVSLGVPCPPCVDGDILVALFDVANNVTVDTVPSGFALLDSQGGSTDHGYIYTKTASSEAVGTDFTFGASGGTGSAFLQILSLSSAAVEAYTSAYDSTVDTAADIPALTMEAQTPHALLFAWSVLDTGNRSQTAPSGYTLLWDQSSTSGGPANALALKYETGSNPPATSFTISSTTASSGFHFATAPGVAPAINLSRSWGYIIG